MALASGGAAGEARPAVFLDKDGTLVENVPFNADPGRVTLTRGAAAALASLHRAGFALVVVSNQPGLAEGRFTTDELAGVEARVRELLGPTPLRGFEVCPHAARQATPCGCRKPAPGLLLAAARRHRLDLSASWMIGDILDDVEAGRAAGCRTILLDTGGETEWRLTPARQPDYRCRTLSAAAELVLASRSRSDRRLGTVVAGPPAGAGE